MANDIDQSNRRKRNLFEYLFNKFNGFYEQQFSTLGYFIGHQPYIVFSLSFLLTGLCSCGLFRYQMLTNNDDLFIPIGCRSVKDGEIISRILPINYNDYHIHHDYDLGIFGDVIFFANDFGDITRPVVKRELGRIYNLIQNINITFENRTYFYRDVCAKRQNRCVIDGELFFRPSFWQHLRDKQLDKYMINGLYTDEDGEPNLLPFIFGKNFELNTKQGVLFSKIVKIHFNLRRNLRDKQTNRLINIEHLSRMWEQAFLKFFQHFKSIIVTPVYSVSTSIDQELDNNIKLDYMLVVITFIIMILVATFCLAIRGSIAQSPAYLSFIGVLATLFGLISGFGFCSLIGIPMCSLVFVTPFLIIGVGTDDMFLIYSAYRRTKSSDTTCQRLSNTFRICGSGITITSLTNIIAFLAGSTTNFYSIRLFCFYTSASIAFCYIYQITLFGSAVAIYNECVNHNRHTLIPCLIDRNQTNSNQQRRRRRRQQCLPWKEMFVYLTKPLFSCFGQITICICFFVYMVCAIYGALQMKDGMKFGQLLNDKSYAKTYFDMLDKEFELYPLVQFVITEPIPYWRTDYMKRIQDLKNKAKSLDGMDPNIDISWFSLIGYESQDYPFDNGTYFMDLLHGFLNIIPIFEHDLIMNKTHVLISRFYLKIGRISYNSSDGYLVRQLRTLTEQSKLPIIIHSSLFKYYEQMYEVIPNIVQTFSIAICAMFIATFLIIPDIRSVLIVISTMFTILTSLVAVLHVWGVQASSIMMIELVMSIGFCSDFCVHIVHAFLTSRGTRKERARQALIHMGMPILCASLSSIIGVLCLGFANSYLFRTFFKTILSLMILGVLHALCFLPVILSLIGSHWSSHIDQTKDQHIVLQLTTSVNNGQIIDEYRTKKCQLQRAQDTIEEEDDGLLTTNN